MIAGILLAGNECHESCTQPKTGDRHCWGEGPDMCQECKIVNRISMLVGSGGLYSY